MTEILKDFIKFVAEVVALLLIFSVVFGPQGMAPYTFNYLSFTEPIMLQNYIASALTVGSQAEGNFSSGVRLTSGLPHLVKIFFKNGIPYVNVIPSQQVFLGTTYAPIDPVPVITGCSIQEQDLTLPQKTAQKLIVEKTVLENGDCKLTVTMEAGTVASSNGGS